MTPFYGGLVYTGDVLQQIHIHTHTAGVHMHADKERGPKAGAYMSDGALSPSLVSGLYWHAEHKSTCTLHGKHAYCGQLIGSTSQR